MARDYESVSSIETFLNCPRAYYLSYIAGLPAKVSPAIEFGSWVHKELEKWGRGDDNIHSDAVPFVTALADWLRGEGARIKAVEHEFKVVVKGQAFKGVIDAICDNSVALEYKITTNPDNFRSKISYQLALYSYYLKPKDIKPVYLLFEIDRQTRAFKKLHIEYVPVSDLLIHQRLNELLTAVKMIKACREECCFPPSWNGCRWCFYKDYCEEYIGG
jgi:CRISPR/Cas system-associated exonuclease Cas4 (RecB family)